MSTILARSCKIPMILLDLGKWSLSWINLAKILARLSMTLARSCFGQDLSKISQECFGWDPLKLWPRSYQDLGMRYLCKLYPRSCQDLRILTRSGPDCTKIFSRVGEFYPIWTILQDLDKIWPRLCEGLTLWGLVVWSPIALYCRV